MALSYSPVSLLFACVCVWDGLGAGSLLVSWCQPAEPVIVLSGMYCVANRPEVMLHLEA